ncbi:MULTISPECIES: hypothetical protein [unclassified Rhodococcus (in: high G+C Gram-positive bacteria)]|uniref:hypothetical protein n=1 Tax=unclassified Rhodococcus (in: high G+C Gram-positive bacteria) TaxID=192944 RepID=UPI0002E44574|nr:hypothetical protein [Rhodococcus sp. DK17]
MSERDGVTPPDRTDVRRHEFRLSMLVASMAVVGTLIGSVCGGVFTLLNTSNQVEATVSQSSNEFLRTQRQQIYSELLTAANEVRITSGSVSVAFDHFDGTDLMTMIAEVLRPLPQQNIVLGSKFTAVELIGSEPVVESARRMVVEYLAGSETVGWLSTDFATDDAVSADTLSTRQQQFADHFQAGMSAQDDFLAAVRDELGIPEEGDLP